jgi:hypothetical protein
MSREVSADFKELTSFIENYNLKGPTTNKYFIRVLSEQHKKFFSYLTCVAELNSLTKDTAIKPIIESKQMDFLIESCSDVANALFVMTHGAYKAARMMLRSSIETFLKGFNIDSLVDLDKEKSVFTIFDSVIALPFFIDEPQKKLLDIIHADYKLLCQDTHTATIVNMQQITAMKYFPTFELAEASRISDILMRLVQAYLTLLCVKYNAYFHKMHHRNKEIIIESIPKSMRQIVHGIND